jgi:hypothetical protein
MRCARVPIAVAQDLLCSRKRPKQDAASFTLSRPRGLETEMKKLIALAGLLTLAAPAFANLVVAPAAPTADDKSNMEFCLELQGREPVGDELLIKAACDFTVEAYVLKSKAEVLVNRLANQSLSNEERASVLNQIDFINKKLSEMAAPYDFEMP